MEEERGWRRSENVRIKRILDKESEKKLVLLRISCTFLSKLPCFVFTSIRFRSLTHNPAMCSALSKGIKIGLHILYTNYKYTILFSVIIREYLTD